MTEITMAKMSQLSETQKEEVRKIFVTSYYKDMKTLHRDTERLLGGFRRLLQEDLIRVAMDGDRPVAMVGCSTNKRRAMEVNKEDFLSNFGFIWGNVGYFSFRKEYGEPLAIDDDTLYFECVATNEADRRQGVAGQMLLNLIETEPYKTFALDVVDSNGRAQSVYERIGFREMHRKKSWIGKIFMDYSESIWMSRPKHLPGVPE